MYTGGLANILYVFLNNSWPSNQHGYTCEKGVNSAWKFILKKVISFKFIFEFDLVGYFNNISHRCVVDSLARYKVPKHIIILLVLLSGGDIQNINQKVAEVLLVSQPPTWYADWTKHEYIHKFRTRFRPKGFGQGNSLSPLLSVLPLLVTDVLETHGIKTLSYCDDGILYGNCIDDYISKLQQVFDVASTGVKVHSGKSGFVKKDGVWLRPLKFVGCTYNPFTDILSASTRNGATLPMSVDLVGLLSSKAKTITDPLFEAIGPMPINDSGYIDPDVYYRFDPHLEENPFESRDLNSIVYSSELWERQGIYDVEFNWNS
jgi:hypothetical protein